MICPKCQSYVDDGAMFCPRCGAKIHVPSENQKSYSDYLLFAWVILTFGFGVIHAIITHAVPDWYSSHIFRPIMEISFILQNITQLLVPISIKSLPLKIIGIILVAIIVIYWVISNIIALFQPYYDYMY